MGSVILSGVVVLLAGFIWGVRSGIDYDAVRVESRRTDGYNFFEREGLAFSRLLTSPLNVVLAPLGRTARCCNLNGNTAEPITMLPAEFTLGVVYGAFGTFDEACVGTFEVVTSMQVAEVYYPWESYVVVRDCVLFGGQRRFARENEEVTAEDNEKSLLPRENFDKEADAEQSHFESDDHTSEQNAANECLKPEDKNKCQIERKKENAPKTKSGIEAEKERLAAGHGKKGAEEQRIVEEKHIADAKRMIEEEKSRVQAEQAKKLAEAKRMIEDEVRRMAAVEANNSQVLRYSEKPSIPTAEEISAVMPRVEELTRNDFAALKARKKPNVEKADALLACIAADDSPAFKFVLRQMAFRRYLVGSAFDKADRLYSDMHGENGVEYALEMVRTSEQWLGNAAFGKTAELVLKAQILADRKSVKTVIAIRTLLSKSPNDKLLRELLAFEYVACGDWASAIVAFRGCTGELSSIAEWETNDTRNNKYDAAKIAEFWWNLSEERFKDDDRVAESMKVHAAHWCKKALALNILSEQDAKLAVWRVNKCEAFKANSLVKERQENGLYMIVDLAKSGSRAVSYLDDVPEGGWSDEYRTNNIVLRRISPGSFEYEPDKAVKITKPFYMGVFEVTQKQYEMMMTANPSEFKGSMRPVENIRYRDIRGATRGQGWPKDNSVDNDSYLGMLRKRIGLEFDLPTEAQWEYACRAGTDSDLKIDGVPMKEIGKCADTGGKKNHHVKVGSFMPNAWGLYDMQGNVWEWCRDWYGMARQDAEDPVGPADGSLRALRGGGWDAPAVECRPEHRNAGNPGQAYGFIGFRICCPAEL